MNNDLKIVLPIEVSVENILKGLSLAELHLLHSAIEIKLIDLGLIPDRGEASNFFKKVDSKTIRRFLSLSQQDLADATGIPKGRIAQWEIGNGNPKSEDREKLKVYFETQMKERFNKSN